MKHKRKKVSQLLRLHTIIYYTNTYNILVDNVFKPVCI